MALLRAGSVALRGGVTSFTEAGVRFADGAAEAFDAVVLATGYRAAVADYLEDASTALDRDGTPLSSGTAASPGLYFCGFRVTPIGMLKQIGIEARGIASAISRGR